ncbi:uncharacterized protein V6R79_004804 [Siganus canaliculatus]
MDTWSGLASVSYKRWRNPDESGEAAFVCQSDEEQGTDTNASSGGQQSASRSGFDDNEETFTVDQALETIGFGKFQLKMCFLTGLSWIGDAMEMMILSVLGPQLHCEWSLPSLQVALITSVVFVGMAIGAPVWGNLSDHYGRRIGLMVCMCWTLFYGLLSAFAPVYGWLLVLRGLTGCGIGGAPQAVTLYLEFLPMKTRGVCVMLISAFWSFGAMVEVLLALWIMPTLGWRWLLGLSSIPVVIFVCLCFWLPESPRFDMLAGNPEKAVATLRRVAKENGKDMPPGKIVTLQQKGRGLITHLFAPQYWRTTLLLWFIWFANAFSYYGIVLLTTELLQSGDSCGVTQGAKTEPSCSLECKCLTTIDYRDLLLTTLAEFPGLLVTLVAVDRIGRKRSMAMCFFVFSLSILPLYACIGRVALTIFIFIARAFITGGFQVAFVYTPEVFPTEIRALAMGACSTLSKIGALITPFVSQVMLRTSVYSTLSLYCGCCLLAGVACLILPIETLGKGLHESGVDQEPDKQPRLTPTNERYGTTASYQE